MSTRRQAIIDPAERLARLEELIQANMSVRVFRELPEESAMPSIGVALTREGFYRGLITVKAGKDLLPLVARIFQQIENCKPPPGIEVAEALQPRGIQLRFTADCSETALIDWLNDAVFYKKINPKTLQEVPIRMRPPSKRAPKQEDDGPTYAPALSTEAASRVLREGLQNGAHPVTSVDEPGVRGAVHHTLHQLLTKNENRRGRGSLETRTHYPDFVVREASNRSSGR